MEENNVYFELGSFDYEETIVSREAYSFNNVSIKSLNGNCKIQIKGMEGVNEPHVHLTCPGFECCISLKEPKYFNHEPHMKPLNKKGEKSFYDFMKSKPTAKVKNDNPLFANCETNYEVACMAYKEANNANFVLPKDALNNNYCLDYSKLK